jgi:hypothetical protein
VSCAVVSVLLPWVVVESEPVAPAVVPDCVEPEIVLDGCVLVDDWERVELVASVLLPARVLVPERPLEEVDPALEGVDDVVVDPEVLSEPEPLAEPERVDERVESVALEAEPARRSEEVSLVAELEEVAGLLAVECGSVGDAVDERVELPEGCEVEDDEELEVGCDCAWSARVAAKSAAVLEATNFARVFMR